MLAKRSKPEFIKSLFLKGEVYLNTVSYFRTCDDHSQRQDVEEGSLNRKVMKDVNVKICKSGMDMEKDGIEFQAAQFRLNMFGANPGNIYSLSGVFRHDLQTEPQEMIIDISAFGESLLLIYNVQEFLDRLEKALKVAGFTDMKSGIVSYYENDYSGVTDIFRKPNFYSAQKEFRIFVPSAGNAPIKVEIGCMDDIAVMIDGATEIAINYGEHDKFQMITPNPGHSLLEVDNMPQENSETIEDVARFAIECNGLLRQKRINLP